MMKTKSLKQVITLKAEPHTVYETFMDSTLHSKLTGSAYVERKVGGKFSVFDGYATGETLELIKDKLILQSWRASDWDDGVYSKIRIELQKAKGGTRLTFTQTGIPPAQLKDIEKGWIDNYWTPLKKMYAKK
jgi:activator of HSP90 ATPase